MSLLFRELHEARMEVESRREHADRSQAWWERDMARSREAAAAATRQQIEDRQQRIGLLTTRVEELDASIKDGRRELEDADCLHETRKIKLNGAIQDLKGEIAAEMERNRQLAEEDSALRAEIAALEKNLSITIRKGKVARRDRAALSDEYHWMRSDYRDLRRAESSSGFRSRASLY
jgi:chromosome segregation ATPase